MDSRILNQQTTKSWFCNIVESKDRLQATIFWLAETIHFRAPAVLDVSFQLIKAWPLTIAPWLNQCFTLIMLSLFNKFKRRSFLSTFFQSIGRGIALANLTQKKAILQRRLQILFELDSIQELLLIIYHWAVAVGLANPPRFCKRPVATSIEFHWTWVGPL